MCDLITMMFKLFAYLSLTVANLRADFDCLCNYNVEKSVFSSPSEQSQPIGYLYEFDCKPKVTLSPTPSDWIVVAYEHQTGYVLTDAETRVQVCPGEDSPDDETGTLVCPMIVQQSASKERGTLFINGKDQKCYEIITTLQSWEYAERDCQQKGGHLATIDDALDEDLVYRYVKSYGHLTWIGLHDKYKEGHFEWASEEPVVYLNWQSGRNDKLSHGIEDCVAIGPINGTWQDLDCLENHAYICEFNLVNGSNNINTTVPTGTYTDATSNVNTTIHTKASTHLVTTFLPTTAETIELLTKTSQSPTTASTTNVLIPSTTSKTTVCPMFVQQSALKEHGTLFINAKDKKCYELIETSHSWVSAERDCKTKGGHLATINDSLDEDLVYRYVKSYGHATWIGLHDMNKEEHFEWASGEPVTYFKWHSGRKDIFLHGIEDCVAMGPNTGTWEDLDCLNRYAYICEFDTTNDGNNVLTTVQTGSFTDGNTAMCSTSLKSSALNDHAVLGQYRRSCYELISHTKVRWEHGESMCKSRGGHLAHISNADEQSFVQYFMNRYSPQHAVWIGLHDTRVEGQFEWTTGNSVSYTNWVPGHKENFVSSGTEDCVAFIPYKNGQWDDIPCGSQSFLFGDTGETHPILCQYDIDSAQIVVG